MLDVTCAIIIRDSKILLVRRSPEMRLGGKWEFPGGKLDEGESLETCIVREIKEELLVDIAIIKMLEPVFYSYPRGDIRLIPFVVELFPNQLPKLTEHDAMVWCDLGELKGYDLAPADIPVLKQLHQLDFANIR